MLLPDQPPAIHKSRLFICVFVDVTAVSHHFTSLHAAENVTENSNGIMTFDEEQT